MDIERDQNGKITRIDINWGGVILVLLAVGWWVIPVIREALK